MIQYVNFIIIAVVRKQKCYFVLEVVRQSLMLEKFRNV